MPRRARRLLPASLAAVLLAGVGSARAGDAFPAYRPLTHAELFANRIRFRGGVPMVSVGVVEGVADVSVDGAGAPLRLVFDEGGLPKTLYADGATFRFRVAGGARPARRRWWVRVAVFDDTERTAAGRALAQWRRRRSRSDLEARLEPAGGLFAVSGAVLDTRSLELLVGGFEDRARARGLLDRLFRERGVRGALRPSLERPPTGRIEILDAAGRRLHVAQDVVYAGSVIGGELTLARPCAGEPGCAAVARRYPGHLYLTVGAEGGLTVVASADAETLLRGVVPAEIFASGPRAALEAQAIVARGAVLSMLGHRHHDAPFHLCDRQHCQVYGGAGSAQPATDQAVLATRGRIAVRPRSSRAAPLQLVDSLYSSSCGGHGAANDAVWDQPPSPSLRPRLDGHRGDPALEPFRAGITQDNLRAWVEGFPPTFCARASFARPEKFRWTRVLEGAELRAKVERLGIGALTRIEVLGRGRGGRVTGLRITGPGGKVDVLRELPVRRLFGLLSGAFVLDVASTASGELSRLTFTGAGWGHGVGMCQMGAIGRAEAGQSAADILDHYYSGAVIERLY